MSYWHELEHEPIPHGEMVIWARRKPEGGWGVGLAYLNVSGGWSDAYGAPSAGWTHWHEMPEPPQ